MSDTIIKVENLGKKYIIGHQAQSGWKPNRGNYVALRDVVTNSSKSFGKRLLGKEKKPSYTTEEFWALKDINFEIKQGEVVGIIGRNGAGKSTLLKILSRITEPTTGRVELRGRVASLLEVGTGFHPELTGRENIYLNGSILGMSRIEIRKKFDEIVDFAEVEKFLDTPVKRYSSGMYVRLAFAVAAHLEPEILVVDEVLAVGDAAFQKKCLGKMGDVATQEGRTVLLVSHNMGTIQGLCHKGFLLDTGRLVQRGAIDGIISKYLSNEESDLKGAQYNKKSPRDGQKLKINSVILKDDHNNTIAQGSTSQIISIEINFEVLCSGTGYVIAAELHNTYHGCIFTTSSMDSCTDEIRNTLLTKGNYTARFNLPVKILRGGEYFIRVSSTIPCMEVLDVFPFELNFKLLDTTSPIVKTGENRRGICLPIISWDVHKKNQA